MHRQSLLKAIQRRNNSLDQSRRSTFGIFGALFFDALLVVIKISLAAKQGLPQVIQVRSEFCNARIGRGAILLRNIFLTLFRRIYWNSLLFLAHGCSPLGVKKSCLAFL